LRDLFLRPLLPHELNQYDVAIIDPPRAGAKHQMAEILQSDLKKLVMISCNPITFARDVQCLTDAGYKMGAVTPVDQFLYSPHLEIISVFEK
jgi:23S rRNA (uracil1939-C5)-methyltransferase